MIKYIFSFAGILWIFTLAVLGTPSPTSADQVAEIEVNARKGMLSVNVENVPLADILLEIGDEAGFRLVLFGGLESTITQRFSNVPMQDGIRRLAGNRSVAFIYRIIDVPDDRKEMEGIQEVWVFDKEGSRGMTTHAGFESSQAEPGAAKSASGDPTQEDQARPGPTSKWEQFSSRHQLDETTDVGYWAGMLFNQDDRATREQALTALQRIGSDEALAAMATVLGDDDAALRCQAVLDLGKEDNARSVQLLGQALIGDADPSVRMTAVRSFAERTDEVSRAFLNTALEDEDERIQSFAKQALDDF